MLAASLWSVAWQTLQGSWLSTPQKRPPVPPAPHKLFMLPMHALWHILSPGKAKLLLFGPPHEAATVPKHKPLTPPESPVLETHVTRTFRHLPHLLGRLEHVLQHRRPMVLLWGGPSYPHTCHSTPVVRGGRRELAGCISAVLLRCGCLPAACTCVQGE